MFHGFVTSWPPVDQVSSGTDRSTPTLLHSGRPRTLLATPLTSDTPAAVVTAPLGELPLPFTLSHAAAVLPALRRDGTARGPLVASALVAGSFSPDMTYFAATAFPGAMELGDVTHSPSGSSRPTC